MSAEIITYWVPEFIEEWLEDKISILNRRAAKLNASQISYRKTDNFEVRKIFVGDPESLWYEPGEHNYKNYKFVEVNIVGEAPKLNGWKFVGVVQHMEVNGESRNILRLVEGESVPEKFRYTENKCDHCMFIRNRNDTYLVQKDETVLQIGSSCLKDFTGHKNPHAFASFAEDYLDFLRNLEENKAYLDELGSFHNRIEYYPIETFLSFVMACIKKTGYISRRAIQTGAAYSTRTTAQQAWDELTSPLNDSDKVKLLNTVTDNDLQTISNAIAWAVTEANKPSNHLNDYLWNLGIACSQEYVSRREIGLVASVIQAYNKVVEKQRLEELKPKSGGYIGEIGKRTNLGKLCLISVKETESTYGVTYIHKFSDCNGNIVIWFTGSVDLRDELEDGWVVENAVATVKNHNDFRGELQTVVTRMKW